MIDLTALPCGHIPEMGCVESRCAFRDAQDLRACIHRGCPAHRCLISRAVPDGRSHRLRLHRAVQ